MMVERIEIDGGVLTAEMLISRGGPYATSGNIGQHRFFVTLIEPDRAFCIWDGPSYDDAIVFAEKARTALWVSTPVQDWVGLLLWESAS
jgi:hypothetical protein